LNEKLGFVVSETYADITTAMETVAKKHAEFLGAKVAKIIRVPGCFDMPLAVKKLAEDDGIDGVVTLGAVIEGSTDHDVIVAQNAARKIADLAVLTGKPISLGVSGPKMTRGEASQRIDRFAKNAVEATLKMIKKLK
jgi:6,7-dimethyl-8-ribityllumazine synthase